MARAGGDDQNDAGLRLIQPPWGTEVLAPALPDAEA
jgi:hypothetical protein